MKFTMTSDMQKVNILSSYKFTDDMPEYQKQLAFACLEFKRANLLDSHLCRLRGRQHLLNAMKVSPRHMDKVLMLLAA